MKKFLKIVSINLSIFIALILLFELVLTSPKEIQENSAQEYYQKHLSWPLAESKYFNSPWSGGFEANPVFGVTRNRTLPFVNNYGIATLDTYPYVKKNNKEITIGLYGASVAEQLYWVIKEAALTHPAFETLRSCGYQIKFLSFAISAGRAPQPMHVFLHTSPWLDVVVKLDGHNDVTDINRELPSDFPALTAEFYDMSDEKLNLKKDIYYLRKAEFFLVNLPLEHTGLQKSKIFYYTHKSVINLITGMISKKLIMTSKLNSPTIKSKPETENRLSEMLETWQQSTKQMHVLSESENKLNFYFIQPTQYVLPAKPMNQAELSIAISKDKYLKNYCIDAFTQLEKKSGELKKKGLKIYSLSSLFTKTAEVVFADDCCHVNELGNKILSDEIIKTIAPAIVKKYSCR
jgi:hypothetical protein